MVSVYLAHNFAARGWLNAVVVPAFREAGIEVTSNWIWDDSHKIVEKKEHSALQDCRDVSRADVLVLFTYQYGETPGRGKYFEFGWASALGKPVYLVGSEEDCVFYDLPLVVRLKFYKDVIEDILSWQPLKDTTLKIQHDLSALLYASV